jgi:di/tricarboxylate transporter
VQIILLLVILAVALLFFSFEWVSADIVGLGVVLALVLTGLLPVEDAFRGFGSETVIMIFALLVLTAALVRTGVVEMAGRSILNRIGDDPRRMLLIIMVAAASLSSFMSNTAAAALFVPIVIGLSRRLRVSPSLYLMPLAFASILASSVTLIGTSTNIVVSGLMSQHGLEPLGMFELTPVGVPIAILGLAYMYFLGPKLIPNRSAPDEIAQYGLRPFLTEVVVLPESSLSGKTLSESGLGRNLDLTVLRVMRDGSNFLAPQADLSLQEGDVLLVEGQRDDILKIKNTAGISMKADVDLPQILEPRKELRLAEMILLLRSPLVGRTLKGLGFRERYGLQVLAINRHGEMVHQRISQLPLRMGDVLLVQGQPEKLQALEKETSVRLLEEMPDQRINLPRARLAVGIFLGAILIAGLDLVSLPVAMLLGAVGVFLTRCITPEEAYREIEWKAIILIGSMLAFGSAMEATGTARFLALGIVQLVGNAEPVWLLSGFFLLTVALTQPMSNQAAAVVVLPVALAAARELGLDPRPFAVMIAVAASTSYITPLEPACLMVYGLGRYKFFDFIKVGSLLTVVVYVLAILIVPLLWPLQ